MGGDSGSPFENTARALRVRALHRAARSVLSQLTDATRVVGGKVIYPGAVGNEMTIKELGRRAGYGVSSTQRALKKLQVWKLLKIVVRPGKGYVFIPLVNQLPLSLLDGAEQPPLPDLQAAARAVELEAHPASRWSRHGQQGQFVPVGDFHRIGTLYRSSVENSDAPTLDFGIFAGGTNEPDRYKVPITSVQSTDPIGTLYRSSTGSKEVQKQTQKESPRARRADTLPMMGIPMTAEQRQANAREASADANRSVILSAALHLGHDAAFARGYLPVPIDTEGDLLTATKHLCGQTLMQYDLHTPEGESVVQFAVQIAWKRLVREGVKQDAQVLRDMEWARQQRIERRRRRGSS